MTLLIHKEHKESDMNHSVRLGAKKWSAEVSDRVLDVSVEGHPT